MDTKTAAELKARLKDQQKKIEVQLESITKEKDFNKDKVQAKWQDLGDKDEDNALEVADFQDAVALERNLEVSLEKIQKALNRIAQGTYGTCERCSKPIEMERLQAYPEAARCLSCTIKK